MVSISPHQPPAEPKRAVAAALAPKSGQCQPSSDANSTCRSRDPNLPHLASTNDLTPRGTTNHRASTRHGVPTQYDRQRCCHFNQDVPSAAGQAWVEALVAGSVPSVNDLSGQSAEQAGPSGNMMTIRREQRTSHCHTSYPFPPVIQSG
nr:unnamed protein product [Callosobruchus analis]